MESLLITIKQVLLCCDIEAPVRVVVSVMSGVISPPLSSGQDAINERLIGPSQLTSCSVFPALDARHSLEVLGDTEIGSDKISLGPHTEHQEREREIGTNN